MKTFNLKYPQGVVNALNLDIFAFNLNISMLKFQSHEVRWFCRGAIPASVNQWFKSIAPAYLQSQNQRTDYYLKPANNPSTGVKLREGRFEVKAKNGDHSSISHKNAEGKAEFWIKWSGKLQEDQIPIEILNDKNNWMEVGKIRSLYAFGMNTNDVEFSTPGANLPNGCIAELTDVLIVNQHCWTLGLEAFGDLAALENNLFLALDKVLNIHCPVPLVIQDSFSYPEWLENFK